MIFPLSNGLKVSWEGSQTVLVRLFLTHTHSLSLFLSLSLSLSLSLKAENTFLLALDGDTDFTPGSIKILLDRMKDEKVGAACGRIHPIGNGEAFHSDSV